MKFNIFYLNFSKVYEIKMLLNNVITESYTKESISEVNSNKNINFTSNDLNFGVSKDKSEYFKLTESLKVKDTKSIHLMELLNCCYNPDKLDNDMEGSLVKLDNVKITFLDDMQIKLVYSMLSKNALRGIKIEDTDVDNLFSSLVEGTFFLLNCNWEGENIAFKIPIESKSEFESNYSIHDLLIGKLSIVGIYKGKVNKKDISQSNITYFDENQNIFGDRVKTSNVIENTDNDFVDGKIHYIDILAIIQNLNFKEQNTHVNVYLYKKVFNWIKGVF